MIKEEDIARNLESSTELERLKKLKKLDGEQKKVTMFVLAETETQKKAFYKKVAEISDITSVDRCIANNYNFCITIKSENPLSAINSIKKISSIEDVKEFNLYSSTENNPVATETVMKEIKRNSKCRNHTC